MAILAQLGESRSRRRSARRALRLQVLGRDGSAAETNVVIHNISHTGLLLETLSGPLPPVVDLELPGGEKIEASVVWNSGSFFGCEFKPAISQAVLSAALLKSVPAEGEQAQAGQTGPDFVLELRQLGERLDRLSFTLDGAIEALAPATSALAEPSEGVRPYRDDKEARDDRWPFRWRLRIILALSAALWGALIWIAMLLK